MIHHFVESMAKLEHIAALRAHRPESDSFTATSLITWARFGRLLKYRAHTGNGIEEPLHSFTRSISSALPAAFLHFLETFRP